MRRLDDDGGVAARSDGQHGGRAARRGRAGERRAGGRASGACGGVVSDGSGWFGRAEKEQRRRGRRFLKALFSAAVSKAAKNNR
jgi:hypothetical protein